MIALIIRRLLQAIPVLFIVVTLTFLLVRSAPGNPFSTEKKIPKEIMEQLEVQYDLHGSIAHQYGQYMWKVVHGDLSISTQYRNRTVNEIIAQTLPVSVTLGSLAYALALISGIVLGAWAAVRHNGWGRSRADGRGVAGDFDSDLRLRAAFGHAAGAEVEPAPPRMVGARPTRFCCPRFVSRSRSRPASRG